MTEVLATITAKSNSVFCAEPRDKKLMARPERE